MGAPPVQPGQVEAVRFVQEVAAEPNVRFDLRLRPGIDPLLACHADSAVRLANSLSVSCHTTAEAQLVLFKRPWRAC